MDETDEYAAEAIKTWVWSGYYSPDDVAEMLEDIVEEEGDAERLSPLVQSEFERKSTAERDWPAVTDCDRLDQAFARLGEVGIIALQNAGYTMSDGFSEVAEELARTDRSRIRGYCFFHGQDLERAVNGGGLMLAFGDLEDVESEKTKVGLAVKEVLEAAGFCIAWDHDAGRRISLPSFDWKKRGVAT